MQFAATWMDLEIAIPYQVKSERERQMPYDMIYMCNTKEKILMNLFTKQKQTQRLRK